MIKHGGKKFIKALPCVVFPLFYSFRVELGFVIILVTEKEELLKEI